MLYIRKVQREPHKELICLAYCKILVHDLLPFFPLSQTNPLSSDPDSQESLLSPITIKVIHQQLRQTASLKFTTRFNQIIE